MGKNIHFKIMILFCGAVLIMVTVTGGLCYFQYQNDLKNAHRETRNIAVSLHEHASREFYRVANLLSSLGSRLPEPIENSTWNNDLQSLLNETNNILPYVKRIQILDHQGKLSHDSESQLPRIRNYSDQEFFQIFSNHSSSDLFIGYTKIDTETQLRYIPVSHPVTDKTGNLNGVLVAWVAVDLFHDLYRSFDIGKNSVIALLRQDGWLMARVPVSTEMIGKNFSHSPVFEHLKTSRNGTFESLYVHDQSPRISGFSRMDDLNLVVIVGRDKGDLLNSWRQMLRNLILYALAIILVFITFTVFLLYQISGRQKVEASLIESEQKFKNIFENSGDAVFINDIEGPFLEVNKIACEQLGYTRDEMLQLTPMDIDTSDSARLALERIREIKKHRLVFETVFQRKNGTQFPAEINSRQIEYEGKPCILSHARDIAERKLAEKELKESEEMLARSQQIAQVGSWNLDLITNRLTWSDETYRIFGFQPQEFDTTYEAFLEAVHPDDRAAVDSAYSGSVRDDKDTYDIKHRIVRKDTGEIRYLHERCFHERNSAEKIIGSNGMVQDITESVRTQKALLENEAKYRAMMESMNDPAYICSSDLHIEYMNPAMIQRTGGKDLTGQLCYKALHNLDQQCDWCIYERVHNGELFEQQILSPMDQRIYLVAHSPINHVDGSVSKMAVYRDITELKQAEENAVEAEKRFRNLFESISDLIFTQDMEGRFLSVNPAMQKLFGYTEEEFLGRKASEFMKPELKSHYKTDFLDMLKKRGYYEGISSYFINDGSKIYIDYRVSVVTQSKGGHYISGMGKDITEKIKAERKMKQLEAQVAQSQKLETIGTLAGGIAHDFNNILFPILGNTELLLSDVPKDNPMHTNLSKIYSAGMRAAALVKQILTFSRQSASEVQKIQVQPIVKEALNLIRSTIPTSIMIKQNIQKTPIMIKADPTQIHQVVMNLATNAYQAMEETGGELTVSLNQIEMSDIIDLDMKPGEFACLTIADTGPGIDKETINKIFDPFFTTKELGKGTGMGLSVAHGIVKTYDGFIQANSTPGKGSVFKVYFPLIDSQPEPSVSYTEPVVKGGSERLLIVDDEESIVLMTKQVLERMGYAVNEYTSSIKALKEFQNNADVYDMVISDLAMPLMTGDQLAKELIKIRPNIPILLCTGFSEKMTADKAKLLGIKDLLMKPVVLSEVAKTVRKVLDEAANS